MIQEVYITILSIKIKHLRTDWNAEGSIGRDLPFLQYLEMVREENTKQDG
jgi:hypothetical protein